MSSSGLGVDCPPAAAGHHSALVSYVMGVPVVAGVGLAGYDYYVLTYKA